MIATLQFKGFPPSWTEPATAPATRDDSLNEAMERYAAGDDDAFTILYPGLARHLRAFALRLVGSHPIAEDLTQETFLRIHRARRGFMPGARVVPWALAIARNTWLDHARSKYVLLQREASRVSAPRSDFDAESAHDSWADLADSSEEVAIAHELVTVVERVLGELPIAQSEAFILLRFEGLSVREAADVLGTTATAVKLRAFRANAALREALGDASAHARSDPQERRSIERDPLD